MANQPEVAQYDSGVYQLEAADPVDGGVGAVSNKPLLNLANRTAYLYQHVSNLESGATIPPGLAVTNSPVLTGTPTVPTAPAGDSSTLIADTAFVGQAIAGSVNVNVAGNSNITLTQAQWGVGSITFSGALTGNISVIFPTNVQDRWLVTNNATGAFTITCKTAAGSGVVVTQGYTTELFTGGANILQAKTDFPSIVMTGTPVAPTPGQFDNSTRVATTAFLKAAGESFSNIIGINSSTTLSLAAVGAYVWAYGTGFTQTLPAIASVPTGATITIGTPSGVTIKANASELISNQLGAQNNTFALNAGEQVQLVSNGTTWFTSSYATVAGTTAPLFDSSTKLATTAFVQRALGNRSLVTLSTATSYAISVSQLGQTLQYYGTAAATWTLPVVATMGNGGEVEIINSSAYVMTIATSGASDYIVKSSGAGIQSMTLQPGDTIRLVSIGGTLIYATGGSGTLQWAQSLGTTAAQFDNSTRLATTAFVKQAGVSFPTSGVGISASLTLTASQLNGWGQFQANGLTATLPALASVPIGSTFTFLGGATGGTIKANASEVIQTTAAGTGNTLVIGAGENVTITANGGGSAWFVVSDGIAANSPALTGTPTAPTAALGDASTKLATTAFVKANGAAYSGFYAFNANATLTNAHSNAAIQSYASSAITLTLPVGSTVPIGAVFTFFNHGSSVLTVTTQGSDVIWDGSNKQPVTLLVGDNLTIVSRNGTEWDIIGGTASLQYFSPRAATNAQFDNSGTIATTAFVQRALGNYQNGLIIGAATTLTASQVGMAFTTNGYNVTLPAFSAVPAGSTIRIINAGSTAMSVLASGSDKIWVPSNPSATSIPMFATATALFVATTGQWELFDGTAMLQYGWAQTPTPALFDNSLKPASTAFVQRALGNRSLVGLSTSTSLAIAVSQLGQTLQYYGSAAATWTLPTAASMGNGGEVEIINSSAYVLTVVPGGSSDYIVISTGAGVKSVALQPGDTIRLVSVGSTLVYATGGSGTLQWSNTLGVTAAQNDSSARLATNAFVLGQASSTTPNMDGAAAVGSATTFARADHTHPTDTSRQAALGYTPVQQSGGSGQASNKIYIGWSGSKLKAQVDSTDQGNFVFEGSSPAFSGTPTAPTPGNGDNSTRIATTAFVQSQGFATPSNFFSSINAPSRGFGTTYTNSTGKPMAVHVTVAMSGSNAGNTVPILYCYSGGNRVGTLIPGDLNGSNYQGNPASAMWIVPAGQSYQVNLAQGSTPTLQSWIEIY